MQRKKVSKEGRGAVVGGLLVLVLAVAKNGYEVVSLFTTHLGNWPLEHPQLTGIAIGCALCAVVALAWRKQAKKAGALRGPVATGYSSDKKIARSDTHPARRNGLVVGLLAVALIVLFGLFAAWMMLSVQ